MMTKDIQEVKQHIKSKRPTFIRSGATHIKRVSRSGYRKPKGVHNKVGNNKKGRRTTIKTGFGYPKITRNVRADGLNIKYVSSETDIAHIDPKTDIVILASSLGSRKRIEIVELLSKKSIKIDGIEDASSYISQIQESVKKRKSEQQKKIDVRNKKKDEAVKAKAGKKKKDDSPAQSEDQNKDVDNSKDTTTKPDSTDKKEQDKVLISKKQ
ncbi:MAG: eL32 family ribosomal protein [Candidatus Woesearchaeota archaeon]